MNPLPARPSPIKHTDRWPARAVHRRKYSYSVVAELAGSDVDLRSMATFNAVHGKGREGTSGTDSINLPYLIHCNDRTKKCQSIIRSRDPLFHSLTQGRRVLSPVIRSPDTIHKYTVVIRRPSALLSRRCLTDAVRAIYHVVYTFTSGRWRGSGC